MLHHISCDADGEDTPKWAAKAAAEAEAGEPQRQPDFSKAELSPDKPDFFTHDVASGRTPDGAAGWRQTNLRVNMGHRGVPGSSDGHHITTLRLARRPATSSERESLQDAFSTRFTEFIDL